MCNGKLARPLELQLFGEEFGYLACLAPASNCSNRSNEIQMLSHIYITCMHVMSSFHCSLFPSDKLEYVRDNR
jgi:hypothetical protein